MAEQQGIDFAALCERLTGQGMLTEAQIAAMSTTNIKQAGVYFLLLEGRVVYVGKSQNVLGRAVFHLPQVRRKRPRDKEFDAFAYILCDPADLDALESIYIHALKPPLNGGLQPGPTRRAPLSIEGLMLLSVINNRRKNAEARA